VAVNNSIKVGPLVFLVRNFCNHGEHYETSCIISTKALSVSPMRTTFPPYHNILDLVNIIQRERETLQHGSNN